MRILISFSQCVFVCGGGSEILPLFGFIFWGVNLVLWAENTMKMILWHKDDEFWTYFICCLVQAHCYYLVQVCCTASLDQSMYFPSLCFSLPVSISISCPLSPHHLTWFSHAPSCLKLLSLWVALGQHRRSSLVRIAEPLGGLSHCGGRAVCGQSLLCVHQSTYWASICPMQKGESCRSDTGAPWWRQTIGEWVFVHLSGCARTMLSYRKPRSRRHC